MKKLVSFALVLVSLVSLLLPVFGENFTDEMKIPYTTDLSKEDGADSVERLGDHQNSPYFAHPDFYNMKNSDTLTILPNFKTQQQTSEWACGVTSAVMVLDYLGLLNNHNEETLATFRPKGLTSGKEGTQPSSTSLLQLLAIFENIEGIDTLSILDYKKEGKELALSDIPAFLAQNKPMLIGWNDWGGHWQVIIGYDTMGTETEQDDVIIVADPYDTTDHNQDGYGIYPAERFFYNFTMYNFFNEEDGNDQLFIVVDKK